MSTEQLLDARMTIDILGDQVAMTTLTRTETPADDIQSYTQDYISWRMLGLAGALTGSWFPGLGRSIIRDLITTSFVPSESTLDSNAAQWVVHGGVDTAPSIEMELVLPYSAFQKALATVQGILTPEYSASDDNALIVTQVQFSGSSPDLMSPFYGSDNDAFASVRFATWDRDRAKVTEVYRRLHDALMPLGTRPHFGYMHFFSASDLKKVFPRYDDFWAVVDQYDPEGRFANSHIRNLAGRNLAGRNLAGRD